LGRGSSRAATATMQATSRERRTVDDYTSDSTVGVPAAAMAQLLNRPKTHSYQHKLVKWSITCTLVTADSCGRKWCTFPRQAADDFHCDRDRTMLLVCQGFAPTMLRHPPNTMQHHRCAPSVTIRYPCKCVGLGGTSEQAYQNALPRGSELPPVNAGHNYVPIHASNI
jgi:hypothetical protein